MEEKSQKLEDMELQMEKMQQRIDELEHRKKRKPWKIILIGLGVFVAVFVGLAVVLFAMMEMDKESPAMAEQVVQAIIDQDMDKAYDLVFPGAITQKEFAQGFEEMCQVWTSQGAGKTFELERKQWHLEAKDGMKKYTTGYIVTSGEAQLRFSLVRVVWDGQEGMTGAQLGIW